MSAPPDAPSADGAEALLEIDRATVLRDGRPAFDAPVTVEQRGAWYRATLASD
ncbi:hypothetical protein ACO2Q2_08820 [Dyella sp. KRB-257]|uniref:hypothetical protein n=1 Tax=Dyella sp. KRB-257 TaxID=3400915 RepID=UPI003C0A549A